MRLELELPLREAGVSSMWLSTLPRTKSTETSTYCRYQSDSLDDFSVDNIDSGHLISLWDGLEVAFWVWLISVTGETTQPLSTTDTVVITKEPTTLWLMTTNYQDQVSFHHWAKLTFTPILGARGDPGSSMETYKVIGLDALTRFEAPRPRSRSTSQRSSFVTLGSPTKSPSRSQKLSWRGCLHWDWHRWLLCRRKVWCEEVQVVKDSTYCHHHYGKTVVSEQKTKMRSLLWGNYCCWRDQGSQGCRSC